MNWFKLLQEKNACQEGMEFAKQYDTFEEMWNNIPRGDWMLWWAKKVGVDLRTLTLAKALCAKTVIHLIKDERSIKAVEVAEAFGRGNATREELDAAATDAYAAATDAYAADAAYAYTYAASVAAKKANQLETSRICREILTDEVLRLTNKLLEEE